jgi:hypothetical protein
MDDPKTKNEMQNILIEAIKDIDRIRQALDSVEKKVKRVLGSDTEYFATTVGNVRYLAVLEEAFRKDGIFTSTELSDFAKKWGRDPRGTAGYFAGNNPSMQKVYGEKRSLTERGVDIVKEARKEYGDNWIDEIDMSIVGSESTGEHEVIHIQDTRHLFKPIRKSTSMLKITPNKSDPF